MTRHPSSPLVARLAPLHGRPTQRAVLAELRRVILAGDAPPGCAIPLDDVAAALGMSVIPVRESLKILIGEGLVEQHMRGAYTVARLSRSELLELYTVRGVLENTVLAVAVAAAGHADHTHARAALDLLDRATCAPTTARAAASTSRCSRPPGCAGSSAWWSRRGTSPSPTGPWRSSPTPTGSGCTPTTARCWPRSSNGTRRAC